MSNKKVNYPRESHVKWYNKVGKEYYKNYYDENREKVREYQKIYYEKNKEYIRNRQKKYYRKYYNNKNYYCKNKDYFKNYYDSNRQEILDKQNYKKAYGHGQVNIKQGSFIISFK